MEEGVNYQNLKTKIKQSQGEIDDTRKIVEHMKEDLFDHISNVNKKLGNQQKEYIAILGIFSSVVLSFAAGISFTASVLENMSKSDPYWTVSISLVSGIILMNILFILFHYIDSIVNDGRKYNFYHWVLFNAIPVILLVLTYFAWVGKWLPF